MPGSTYSSNLKIELMTTGENSGTWGDVTNTNLGTALEQAIIGYGNPDYTSDANLTITITNSNASQAARCLVLNVTSVFGALTATRELIVPTSQKQYIVQNNTTGGQSITVKTSAGTGITVPNGRKAHLYVNGTDVVQMFDFVDINGGAIDGTTIGAASASTGAFTTLSATGDLTLSGTVGGVVSNANNKRVVIAGGTSGGTTTGAYAIFEGYDYGGAGAGGAIAIVSAAGTTNPISMVVGATARGVFSSTGLAVTGTLSATGNFSTTGSNTKLTDNISADVTVQIGPDIPNATRSGRIGFINSSTEKNWYIANNWNVGGALEFTQTTAAGGSTLSGSPAMLLDRSGNLGIGETTPTAKLHIGVASAGVNGTKGVRIVNPAGTIVMLECGSGGDSFVGTESGSTFNIRTNNAINATFLTSGNVGFGETNPTQKIHFKGSSTTYALAETTGSGTSSGFRMKAGAGTDFTLYTTEGGNQFGIYNNTTSTQPLTIDASGNLGLGVTPSAWQSGIKVLQIGSYSSLGFDSANSTFLGNNWSYSSATYKYINNGPATYYTQTGTGQHQWFNAPSGTANSTTIVSGNQYTIVTAGGNFTAFGAANNNVGTVFTATSSGTATGGAATQTIVFIQAMTLDASGNLTVKGNAATKVVLSSATNASDRGLSFTAADGTELGFFTQEYSTGLMTISSGTGSYSSEIALKTAGTERVRLTSTSLYTASTINVGIGTSNPSNKLTVKPSATSIGTLDVLTGSTNTDSIRISAGGTVNTWLEMRGYLGVKLYSDATNTVTVDYSGNLGLGVTPSAWTAYKVLQINKGSFLSSGTNAFVGSNWYYDGTDKFITNDYATFYRQYTGAHSWHVSTISGANANDPISFTQAMTLDASGSLGVGTTTPQNKLQVATTTRPQFSVSYNGTTGLYLEDATNSAWKSWKLSTSFGNGSDLSFVQSTNTSGTPTWAATAAMTLDASGNLLVGATSTNQSHRIVGKTQNAWTTEFFAPWASTNYGITVNYTAAAPNTTGSWFYYAGDTGGQRFGVASNGGIYNYSANNSNLSDRREKTNFAPAKSYLDVICAIPVQTFNYIDQNMEDDGGLTLGVVAQDVQAVAPELVTETNWASKDEEPKMRLSIYQTDLQYALMKAIQEQQALITTLTARITALEGA